MTLKTPACCDISIVWSASSSQPTRAYSTVNMIRYRYKNARILFVGINPHFGSFDRGVPFSNNKMFWYLLSDAGILKETRNELRDDDDLRRIYKEKFNAIYGLGFVNIINRPTRDITELKKGEELPGRRRITRIIKTENPPVVCFIGRVAYEKYIGSKDFSFGWQEPINKSRIFVMHFPLRGEAIVRTRELRHLVQAAPGPNKDENLLIAKRLKDPNIARIFPANTSTSKTK